MAIIYIAQTWQTLTAAQLVIQSKNERSKTEGKLETALTAATRWQAARIAVGLHIVMNVMKDTTGALTLPASNAPLSSPTVFPALHLPFALHVQPTIFWVQTPLDVTLAQELSMMSAPAAQTSPVPAPPALETLFLLKTLVNKLHAARSPAVQTSLRSMTGLEAKTMLWMLSVQAPIGRSQTGRSLSLCMPNWTSVMFTMSCLGYRGTPKTKLE